MQYTKEQAKESVAKLVEAFKQRQTNGLLQDYKEEQVKKDFILPLFGYLNWNIESDEVRAEYSVTRGEVDYAFKLNGAIKFFLEAKSVREGTEDQKYLRQAINYGYHRSITWVVLTDFKTLKLLNSEFKEQSLLSNVVLRLTTDDYIERFEELWLLSKNSFQDEALDRWAERLGKKSKRTPIDKQLLQNFTEWRAILTKDILVHNKSLKLNEEVLDEVVQRILDRLIFMRKTEDVGLEERNLEIALRSCDNADSQDLYRHIQKVFRKYDNDYDSELFSQHLADKVVITIRVLRRIIEGLYTTDEGLISYNFADIPADVLGNIYEQYLGYILKKTKKGARIDKKLIIRKEQGIYYTPTFIVDFIVQHTLGELLRSQPQIKNVKILDPACGSGSFLIKSFDILNEWSKSNNYSYSPTQILTENLFGVDLDQKAVEVAQLNLLLRSMEKKRLPMLKHNIKCGNSLIADNEIAGDKAFDWHKEFENVMKEGRFDVVIGNPPYGGEILETYKNFIKNMFKSATGRYDSYYYFIEKGISLLKEGGFLGFVVPDTWLTNVSTEKLREVVLDNCSIQEVVGLPQNAFPDANVDTCIIILKKERDETKRSNNIINVYILDKDANLQNLVERKFATSTTVMQKQWATDNRKLFNIHTDDKQIVTIEKIRKNTIKLGEITEMRRGVFCYRTSSLIKEYGVKEGKEIVEKRLWHSDHKVDENYKKELLGSDISRYYFEWKNKTWFKYGKHIASYVEPRFFETDYIAVQRIRNPKLKVRIVATIIKSGEEYYASSGLTSIIPSNKEFSLKYILAILNSKLMNWYYKQFFIDVNIKPEDLRELPIKHLTEFQQESFIKLVDKILSLNEQLQQIGEQITNKTLRIKREIEETDVAIDKAVYKLYSLSETEIQLVEESFRNKP